MTRREIRYSKARAKKGMKPWGVFEVVDEGFSKGLSQHSTETEAKAALAELEKEQNND